MPNVAIRTDASAQIGIGHVMRCLTLARSIKERMNGKVVFVCNHDLPPSIAEQIEHEGFNLLLLPVDEENLNEIADARYFLELIEGHGIESVIVDNYRLSLQWENLINPQVRKILVIDDLADRQHNCDVLLDQNLYPNMETRYTKLIPESCLQLLGPSYAMLRREFYEVRDRVQTRTECKKVLVNFGGSDPTNEIGKVLLSIKDNYSVYDQLHFHVVAGPANTRQIEIKEKCAALPNVTYYPDCSNMADLLAGMDIVIGAGGISLWERCFLGVPSMVVSVADNQTESVLEAERQGLIWFLGTSVEVQPKDISGLLKSIVSNPNLLTDKSMTCLSLMEPLINSELHPIVSLIGSTSV